MNLAPKFCKKCDGVLTFKKRRRAPKSGYYFCINCTKECPKCKNRVGKHNLVEHKKKCRGKRRDIRHPKIFRKYQETQR